MSLGTLKDLAIFISGLIALFTFINGIVEYVRQGRQKRVDQFVGIRRRFKENEIFKQISDMAINNDPALAEIPARDKRDLLGLFEEVALLTNSRLIRKEVAHYMFGLYTVSCWESTHFWSNIDKDSIYLQLFNDFAAQMKSVEQNFNYSRESMRF